MFGYTFKSVVQPWTHKALSDQYSFRVKVAAADCPAEPHLHLLPNILLSRQMGGWLATDVCIFLKQSHVTKENV